MTNDKYFLTRAVKIAGEGIENGAGPFGAVITLDGEIIAEAGNQVVLTGDPTAHAEILAIRQGSSLTGTHDLSSCTLYTSCEPCPMCLGAIYWAGIKKVVYAAGRGDAAKAGFNDDFIYREIALDPADRKISFLNIEDPDALEVFDKWSRYDNKIPY